MLLDMVCRLLSECLCRNFILPETGKPCLLFYDLFNLRNLLYLIAALPSAPSSPGSPAVGKRFCRNGCVGCNRLSRHGSFQRIADCGSAPPPLIVLVNIEPIQIRQHRTIVPASLIFLPYFTIGYSLSFDKISCSSTGVNPRLECL